MNKSFTSAITPPPAFAGPAYWFIFDRFRILVHVEDGRASIPWIADPADLGLAVTRRQYLGYC
ncbi:MAG: hypothetical protein KC425_12285, partial [Anaerolineales bacterium]|nr:hypothetical protein [Anaerolineales bacterium]